MHTDASHEIDALKCILLRENYLRRLQELCRTKDLAPKVDTFADLVGLLRSVTFDTIEHICLWRRNAEQTSQFMWNGVNYLLKIPSDLDFLAEHKQIPKWYGATALRNPFLVSRSLDDSPASTSKQSVLQALQERSKKEAKAKAREKVQKTPYDTPVLNDVELTPATPAHTPKPVKQPAMAPALLRKGRIASKVCEVDMVRVLAAEKTLLQEEERFGVFTRDGLGRIVPLILGKDEANSQGTHSKQPKPSEDEPEQVMPRPLARAKRKGGDLTVLTRKEASGRRHLPTKRSRGALIDVNIKRKELAVGRLSEKLQKKQKELERLQEELTLLVSDHIQDQAKASEVPRSTDLEQRQREVESKVAELQMAVEVQTNELKEQEAALQRKKEARESFKRRQHEAQTAARSATIARKQALGAAFSKTVDLTPSGTAEEQRVIDDVNLDDPDPVQPPSDLLACTDHASAVQIQRIVRGRQGRARFIRIFNERSAGALTIQTWTRMNMGKAAAALFAQQVSAIKLLQRFYRGEKARRYARRLAHAKATQRAAVCIQVQLRAHWGRMRMDNKRTLVRAKRECYSLSQQILQEDLDELAGIKQPYLPPNVHSLLMALLILMARGAAELPHHVERLLSWKACKRAMRRPVFLRKLQTLGAAAKSEAVFLPRSRIAAVARHLEDPGVNVRALAQIQEGSRGAQLLLQWVSALLRVIEVLPQFTEVAAVSCPAWQAVLRADDHYTGVELWEALEDDYDSDGIDPDTYVDQEVLRCRTQRNKPLVLVISSDVAFASKQRLIAEVKQGLPGVFNHVRMRALEVERLQGILESGQSALVECDIGLCRRDRSAFLRMAGIAKASLLPSPDLILVHGDSHNRGPRRTSDVSGITFLGIRDHTGPLDEEEDQANAAIASAVTLHLKGLLEDASTAAFELARPSMQAQLDALRTSVEQAHDVILVMEAVMVLLCADKEFATQITLPAVSWASARTVLDHAGCATLSSALQAVDIHHVPAGNLEALRGYVSHENWPKTSPQLTCTELLRWWVESVVSYASELEALGGPAESVSGHELFSAVVRVADGIQSFPSQFDRGHPVYRTGEVMLPEHGATRAMKHLFEAIMRPLKVYSESRAVPVDGSSSGRKLRLIIHVGHEAQAEKLVFSAYDPETSRRFLTMVDQADVNRLLAPNSIELQDPRRAPRTPQALYMRLVELLTLNQPRVLDGSPKPLELHIRRKRLRLLRTVRTVDTVTVLISANEAAPGEVSFEVYNPARSERQEIGISAAMIAHVRAATMSPLEKQELKSRSGRRMALFLMDRLRFNNGKLGFFTGKVAGRKVFAGSLAISGTKHIVTINLSSATKFLYVSAYEPGSSSHTAFALSAAARKLLLGPINEGHRDDAIQELFARLHLHKPKHDDHSFSTVFRADKTHNVVLDRSMLKQVQIVPDAGGSSENRTFLLHFCASTEMLTQSDDAEENRTLPVVEIIAYEKKTKETLRVTLSQSDMELISPGWTHQQEALRSAAGLLRMSHEGKQMHVYVDDEALGYCDIQQRKPVAPSAKLAESQPEAKRVLPPSIPSNTDDSATLEFVRSVGSVERRRNPRGKVVYKQGHSIDGHYVIVTAWKQSGNGFVLECYEPQSLVRVLIDLSAEEALRRAVGPAQDLVDAGTDLPIITHLIENRITASGSPPVFSVRTSRLFTSDKITPVNKLTEEFDAAVKDVVILPSAGRIKILSLGVKVRVERSAAAPKGDHLSLIITAFETGRREVAAKYYNLTAPEFDLIAYDPANQQKMHLSIPAENVALAFASKEELLLPHNRTRAVKALMQWLRVQKKGHDQPTLILPWARLEKSQESEISAFDQKDLVIATGIKTKQGTFVVVRLTQVCKSSSGQRELHVQAYDPSQGMSARFRTSSEVQEAVLLLRENHKKLVQFLRDTMVAEIRECDGIPTLYATIDITRKEKEVEEEGGATTEEATQEAMLLPAKTISGARLFKAAMKVSGYFCLVSIHQLLDDDSEEPVGIVLQVYCPSIAQLACRSLQLEELKHLLEQHDIHAPCLRTSAQAVSSLFALDYAGVHAHLTIKFLEKE